jgi:DNA ligase-1
MVGSHHRVVAILIGCLLWAGSLGIAAAQAPRLMLATLWDEAADPAGWWLSEKFDGVRGYWDGSRMLTRNGEPIHLPQNLQDTLPPFALDGELWAGRGRFSDTVAVVRDTVPGTGWASIHYLVFDLPDRDGDFEQRMAAFEAWLKAHPANWIAPVQQIRCQGRAHLQAMLADIEARGGEGIMLRAPSSAYRAGRSPDLRKLKTFLDTEATVVGYNPGKGKYQGLVGSLRLELPDGTRFAVGSGLSDAQRHTPPPIGSVVTFKYYGLTRNGKPRFPVFWRLRAP